MNKRFLAFSLATVLAFSSVACSKKDTKDDKQEETKQTAQVDFETIKTSYYGTVKLADYSEFVIYENEKNASDDLIDSQINQIMSSGQYNNYEKTDDTEATEDLVANIDFVGYVKYKGEDYAFPKGSGQGHDLNLSNSDFIPGFAEGVVGMKVGETKDVNVVFPENYSPTQGPDGEEIPLANTEVRFEVKLNYLSKDLGLTDEFVKEKFSPMTGADNVEEFKAYFADNIILQQVGQSGALEKFVEKCEFTPNDELIKKEYESAMSELESSLEENSKSMDDFLKEQRDGQSKEDFEKEFKDSVEEMNKTYAVICALAEDQGIGLSQERFDELLGQIAAQNNYEGKVDEYIEFYKNNYNKDPKEAFPIQFLYQDVMKNTILNKAKIEKGERPTEAATTEDETTSNN
ncbi:MAG: FKBP-type peptidyl-prolyl cis-trans isomerase [Lachnospiraceae bacterium]|nr:FKBP-type peptidyl-prolyl cis-trans isomerase [Lachnospiraceae bacterium]